VLASCQNVVLLLRSVVLGAISSPGLNHAPSPRLSFQLSAVHEWLHNSWLFSDRCGRNSTARTKRSSTLFHQKFLGSRESQSTVASISRTSSFGWCVRACAELCARHHKATHEKHTNRSSRARLLRPELLERATPLQNSNALFCESRTDFS
jgi:hypothetical protein